MQEKRWNFCSSTAAGTVAVTHRRQDWPLCGLVLQITGSQPSNHALPPARAKVPPSALTRGDAAVSSSIDQANPRGGDATAPSRPHVDLPWHRPPAAADASPSSSCSAPSMAASLAVTFIAWQTDLLQYVDVWTNGEFSGVLRGRYELLWILAAMVALA